MNDRISSQLSEQWHDEPDFVELRMEGYHLIVLRSFMKNLNGYVGIKRDHPYYGLSTSSKQLENIRVHGGVTFADKGIHLNGAKKGYWYIGFDTAHAWDYAPGLAESMKEIELHMPQLKEINDKMKDMFGEDSVLSNKRNYRDIEYVSKEVESLMMQLKSAKENAGHKNSHVREYKRLHREKVKREKQEESMQQWLTKQRENKSPSNRINPFLL
jgi:hypothetical protein